MKYYDFYELRSKMSNKRIIIFCERQVLESKDLKDNLLFPKLINGADVELHRQVIIDSKDPLYNYYFASEFPEYRMKEHEQIVLDSKDPKINYLFAKDVRGADVDTHRQVVNESGNIEYIDKFNDLINERMKKDVKRLEKLL